jgi:aldehyde:ferredoxin oxidoreductase
MLISLLLFKGVAAAAMLCCGPEHSAHTEHSSIQSKPSAMAHSMMSEHSHHNTEMPAQTSDMPEHQACDHHQMMADDSVNQFMNDHQSSCSGCAVSCAAAVLMINPSDFIPEPPQNERILSLTSLVSPLTLASLERPPRLYS